MGDHSMNEIQVDSHNTQLEPGGPPPPTGPTEPPAPPSVVAGPRPKRTFAQGLSAIPADIQRWWKDLTEVFDPAFLILIGSVYFLQGMGGFATYITNYYLKRDYSSTCPCMIDDSCNGDIPDGCHAGLHLEPAQMAAVKAFAGLPWNYKIYYGALSDCFPIMVT